MVDLVAPASVRGLMRWVLALAMTASCALAHEDFPTRECRLATECLLQLGETCVKSSPNAPASEVGICTAPDAGIAGSGGAGSGGAGSGGAGSGGAAFSDGAAIDAAPADAAATDAAATDGGA